MANPLIKLPPMTGPRKVPVKAKPPVEAQQPQQWVPLIPLPRLRKARRGWGAIEAGRWFEVGGKRGKVTNVGGVCSRCGRAMPGKELRLFIGPFEEEAKWTCGPCRKEARGLESSEGKHKAAVRRETPRSKRVKDVMRWVMQAGRDPLDWGGPTQYSEERYHQLVERSRHEAWTDEREQREGEWENEGGR